MKILFIAVGDKYGSGKALLSILNQLKKRNITSLVICSHQTDLYPDLDALNVEHLFIRQRFYVYPPTKTIKDIILFLPRLFRDLYVNWGAVRKISKIIKVYKPDIVHTNVGVYRAGLYASQKCGVPHVWHLREYETLDMKYHPIGGVSRIKHLAQLNNNNIICITKGICDYFQLQYKAKIIYDGVNFKQHENVNLSNNNFLLFVGNICEHKGCSDLIEAFVAYRKSNPNSDLSLLLLGNDKSPYSKYIQNKVQQLKFERYILFLGFSAIPDVYMRKAKAIIIPSIFECFGLVTAEAMYNKCLVIGRNTGGTREQFDNGCKLFHSEIGLRFNTQEDLIKLIGLVDFDRIEKRQYVENAFLTVNQLYSESQNVDNIICFYKEILNI